MEGTNGNYEPINRTPGCLETAGTGTVCENCSDPQLCDLDLERYPCIGELNNVMRQLESVERICADMIKKFSEGPGTSQSDVSQCSIENTAIMNPSVAIEDEKSTERKKNREKIVLPLDVIDLTSDDSCDSSTSRKWDQEAVEFGQIQSPLDTSMATGITAVISPSVTPLKRKQPDPPEDEGGFQVGNRGDEPTVLSYNRPYEACIRSSNQAQVRTTGEKEDPLSYSWANMYKAFKEAGVVPGPVAVTGVGKMLASAKQRKVNTNDDVPHHFSHECPSIQLNTEVNELVQMETFPPPKVKKARGRPRKDVGTSQVEGRTKELAERMAKTFINKQKGKEMGETGSREFTEAQINKLMVEKQGNEEHRKVQLDKNVKGKEKELEASQGDEADDEEEEKLGKSKGGVLDLHEGLKILSSNLNGEKVDYDPYRREKKQAEDEDEVEDLFNQMKTAVASISGLTSNMMQSCPEGDCTHQNFDFDVMLGYYCDDCGAAGIEMPTSDTCQHINFEFKDEVGRFCPDCGLVGREIQSYFVQSEMLKSTRKPVAKVQEKVGGAPQFQLNLQDCNGNKDCFEADLQLHPRFEADLHPHQKKGFRFLKENLVGGRNGRSESMGCVLAHAPGTGKTCLMISFIHSFLSAFPEGRPLILAPKIMLQSWENEFESWKVQEVPIYRMNGSTCDTLLGDGVFEEEEEEEDAKLAPLAKNNLKESRALTLREWQGRRGVLLMSYNLFAILVTNGLRENVLPDSLDYQMSKVLLEVTNLVVLDEGHLARNIKTQISQALLAMETKCRVLLSGTLFQNNFKELYTLLKLCRDDFMISHPEYGKRIAEAVASVHGLNFNSSNLSSVKKSKMQIEERIFTEDIGDRLESYVKSSEVRTDQIESVVLKLQSLTASFVDWYPGDILKSLPGLFEYSVHLDLTADQKQIILRLPNTSHSKHHMARLCKLLAACIHPSLAKIDDMSLPFSDSSVGKSSCEQEAHKGVKISFILQLLAFCKLANEKLLIFCTTLAPLTYLEDLVQKIWGWQLGQQILRIDGTMQDNDRQRVIKQFNDQNSQSQLLLASTKACKEGITLVGASRVVIMDNPDNPSVVRQAVSRAFRIGQRKKVFVYRLVTTNREEEAIFRRSVNKERLSGVLLDPVSTLARLGGFLREQSASDIEDQLLQKMMLNDKDNRKCINMVCRYNAAG